MRRTGIPNRPIVLPCNGWFAGRIAAPAAVGMSPPERCIVFSGMPPGSRAGQRDYLGMSRRLRPKSNNNEAIDGLALFCAGLTLETYVTGAKYPVKCSASCGRGNLWLAKPP
jgi:hypothetical protein